LIRRASAADTTGILLCLGAAFQEFRFHYTPEAFADTVLSEATIGKRLREMTVLVAEQGGVVGTVACVRHGDEGYLRGMAVLPVLRGRGVAEQLLAAAEAELAGCSRITLDTTAPLKRAIRFYEKHGYRATGRVTDFYDMPLYEYEKRF